MKTKYIITLLLSCFSISSQAQTLETYLEIAAQNNPKLKAKYAEFEAALERISQVNTFSDPNVSFGYFIQPVQTRVGPQNLKIGLSQMLPWFGELKAKETVAALQAESLFKVFEDDKNALYNTVKADWFTLYALNQQSYFLKENIKIYRIYKDLATVSFKNDKSSMADVLRVDIAIDDLETQVIILDQKIVPIVASFNSYLNRSIFADIDLPEQLTSIDTSLMDIKSNNLVSQNPLVGAYALRIEALESQALVVQKQNNPKIGVGLDYVFVSKIEGSSIPKNGNDIFMPMMSLSIPIHGRKNKARIKEVEFKQVAADSSLQWFTNRLNVRVQQENYLLKSGIEMMDLMDAQIEQTQRVISLLTVAYSNAGKDFEEILRLEQKLLHYKINKVMAESQAHKAVAAIEYLTGTI